MLEDGQKMQERELSVLGGDKTESAATLPNDILVEVAKHLPTDDPVETAANLTSFKLASPSVRASVDQSDVGTFHRSVNRLGASSKALYDLAVPRNGFAEYPNYPEPDPAGEFALASQRIRAIGPTLKFQSPARKTAIGNHILNMSEGGEQAEAIMSMTSHLSDLERADKRRLIDRAIEYFKVDGPINYDSRHYAAYAIAAAHNQLELEHKSQIFDAMAKRPQLARLYADERIHAQEHLGLASTSEGPHERSNKQLATDILQIEQKIRTELLPETLSAHDQMVKAEGIAGSIEKAYRDARANLTRAPRGRSNSDLSR
ncbi:hypothetical protein EXN32_11455 [Agrobacterium tumefaciens]|uniref:Uncharacterized protein n=3 Tax=Rhizobium/Agrobacterium group TaxID=227290 RepID=A0A2Z2PJA0_RHIRH|nr:MULTISPECIES: hypothetical protein [Rhizobium/Agrobacterium group]ASK42888.1 hypothetical protein [Rhizobium rhizogenes]MCZ7976396.1 hypothetical protein [Agrobacterium salinitolerans]MDA5243284.1 hypothetical protein [Agrobacterium sp. MAFF310724]MDA5247534.1 hypothetical protein [Agrobacterium sp. MAFF210268]TRB03216.1 hypothetical protein EXN61_23070 [Agrobacterium tumefaciens]